MTMRIPSFAAALALAAALPVAAETSEGGAMYRCPGNDYNNTISAGEAEKLHCKKVENTTLTVIQSARPPASAASAAASTDAAPPPRAVPTVSVEPLTAADSAALRTRASNNRRSLEGRLKSEESRLSAMEKEFNGGEPERHMDEFDFQKYLDRIAGMRSAITRKQIEIAELRREIDKLPTR
jgi:hypothetical protein